MRVMILDGDRDDALILENGVRARCPECGIQYFVEPKAALTYIERNRVDAAFLETAEGAGMDLARRMKGIRPGLPVIFVTRDKSLALEAFRVHAFGYLVKPYREEELTELLELLGFQAAAPKETPRLQAETFGAFELFYESERIRFARTKTKELFACLVDRRGAGASMQELLAVLFEDREPVAANMSMMRNLVSDLMHTLRRTGAENAVIKSRNSLAVNPALIDCDYYRFLSGEREAILSYAGVYLKGYPWAEGTAAELRKRRDAAL